MGSHFLPVDNYLMGRGVMLHLLSWAQGVCTRALSPIPEFEVSHYTGQGAVRDGMALVFQYLLDPDCIAGYGREYITDYRREFLTGRFPV